MSDFYNDIDPFACEWTRQLIEAGHIPAGDVDERSIKEIDQADLVGRRRCHFFNGLSGWGLALELAGFPESRNVWTGSAPCQSFSTAGKQKGFADDRDLWPDFFRLVRECGPDTLVGEQVEGAIRHGWLDRVCADLASEGYAVGHAVLGAHSVSAPHIRQRLYWVASRPVADAASDGLRRPIGAVAGQGEADEHRRLADTSDSDARGLGHANGDRPSPGVAPAPSARHGRAALADGDAGFWDAYDLIPCRDGKSRRVPAEVESLFCIMDDGFSPILGDVWRNGVAEIQKAVISHAQQAQTGPGKVLFAVCNAAVQKALRQSLGGHAPLSSPVLLLVALCQLAGHPEFVQYVSASDLAGLRQTCLRILWNWPDATTAAARSPHQRGLDGPSHREPEDALHSLPFDRAQQESAQGVRTLRQDRSQAEHVSKALSAVEEIWGRTLNEATRTRQIKRVLDYIGTLAAVPGLPLATRVLNRAGLLKGAGNAICVPTAAAFVRAFLDSESGVTA